MKKMITSQKGFSLIELMIVVAIIGILASIAIPNYTRFQAKARQSEARAMLSGLYTSEKAFQSEWSDYHSNFRVIGYAPEGVLRYNVGFGAATAATPVGYTGPAATAGWDNTAGYCGTVAAPVNNCADNSGGTALAGTSVTSAAGSAADTFIAEANGNIDDDAGRDIWTVDQAKTFLNPTSDL
jgi:type IV pilus assembly protein PilA